MNVFNFSSLIFVLFIVIKIIIYHGMKNIQKQTWFMERLCVNGYYGSVADPFECDAYYQCPEGIKFYCPIGSQFDGDKNICVPINKNDINGCYATASRRLLD
ncbi:PrGVORF8 [Pieris rapae granulovirus Wuhan]|uniref:PrGVORF8 n=1 Tax=Pieris rapae granulovirus Wuhan TaxID=2848030 RepID=D2J4H5_9BBAC|nr:PrGVORF8 [Betabaculovirus arrapae]ACZ63494.1 PrGVORF8 [Betabaculovirus arrapae]ADO85433.1 unknown [Pieris rapae granulovirus]UOS85682.1 ORF8 [Pieris rapae granulovirus]